MELIRCRSTFVASANRAYDKLAQGWEEGRRAPRMVRVFWDCVQVNAYGARSCGAGWFDGDPVNGPTREEFVAECLAAREALPNQDMAA